MPRPPKPFTPPEPWLSVEEAAKLVGLSIKTVRDAVQRGEIAYHKASGQNGTVRIPESAFEAWRNKRFQLHHATI